MDHNQVNMSPAFKIPTRSELFQHVLPLITTVGAVFGGVLSHVNFIPVALPLGIALGTALADFIVHHELMADWQTDQIGVLKQMAVTGVLAFAVATLFTFITPSQPWLITSVAALAPYCYLNRLVN